MTIRRTFSELGGVLRHTLTLSWLMTRFIFRYAVVIFRYRVLERPPAPARIVEINRRTATEYVRAAVKLKGGTIKLGQFLSARADVVPRELVEVLSSLQDRVDPAPFAYVKETIEEQLGRPVTEIFKHIEPVAIAAASFGQVHAAVTWKDERVVVKVLHHNIERSLRIDLAIFRVAVFFFGRLFPRINIDRIYNEIEQVTLSELDYAREADSAERVRKNLAGEKRVRVPKVLREHCTKRVLCLEDISGLRVDDPEVIRRHGASPREIITIITAAFCQQIYVDGFFQSDPHPGNLFFYPPDPAAKDAPLVGIIDFGQAKEIPPEFHASLRKAVLSVIQRDPDLFLDALTEMGIVEDEETHKIRDMVVSLGERLPTGTVSEVMKLDFEQLARDVSHVLHQLDAVTLPNDLVLYGRTLGLLQGLTFSLDPDLPIFEVAAPYLMQFAFGPR